MTTNPTTTKPRKISTHKAQTVYRFGDWMVYTERKTSSTYACGLRKSQSFTVWNAHTCDAAVTSYANGSGGIKAAALKLAKLTA